MVKVILSFFLFLLAAPASAFVLDKDRCGPRDSRVETQGAEQKDVLGFLFKYLAAAL